MNWYKKASLYILGKKDHEWMGNPHAYWEAIRLKNGEILYDPHCNHWSLFATYRNYIGDISNVESIGLLGGDGNYTIKRRGSEVKNYFFSSKTAQQKGLEQYPNYTDIGHKVEDKMNELWISDLSGNNFHIADAQVYDEHYDTDYNYDHSGLAYDVGINMELGAIQGRYDPNKNIVSVLVNPQVASIRELPNRLINRLYKEFGNNITILDYSHGSPKRII